ncbi:MAG: cysteine hydrolase [Candidatus Scalindua sp.]|nr:cysteine hydrolase [Candidatus Scalindua sp.]
MNYQGNLYVSHAEEIIDNLKKLFEYAKKHEIRILSSIDAHTIEDKEFQTFPAHCVKDTRGYLKIDVTRCKDAIVIENKRHVITDFILEKQQIIIEKQSFDIFDNINTDTIVSRLNAKSYVVFGVATEYCVKVAALGLKERRHRVFIVSDAIKAITPDGEKAALKQMKDAGIILLTTDEVIKERRAELMRLESPDIKKYD